VVKKVWMMCFMVGVIENAGEIMKRENHHSRSDYLNE
jgi:hypothetical protein